MIQTNKILKIACEHLLNGYFYPSGIGAPAEDVGVILSNNAREFPLGEYICVVLSVTLLDPAGNRDESHAARINNLSKSYTKQDLTDDYVITLKTGSLIEIDHSDINAYKGFYESIQGEIYFKYKPSNEGLNYITEVHNEIIEEIPQSGLRLLFTVILDTINKIKQKRKKWQQ